jgi:polygalacturonase
VCPRPVSAQHRRAGCDGGRNIHIRNCNIENFDDAVAVKPLNGNNKIAQCSENVLVENVYIRYGLGASIGSVPPKAAVNCVRNVTFRNIQFESPVKAIYVMVRLKASVQLPCVTF